LVSFLVGFQLELGRGLVAEGGVLAVVVVVGLDEIKDLDASVGVMGWKKEMFDENFI
jgi:hypothetical protein